MTARPMAEATSPRLLKPLPCGALGTPLCEPTGSVCLVPSSRMARRATPETKKGKA